MGKSTLLNLTFGAFFFDFDLDGWLDIFCANGHIEEEIQRVQPKITFRQAPSIFRNLSKGRFADAGKSLGTDMLKPLVGRGAAYGDLDSDGDLDVVVTQNHGPAVVYRNDGGNTNRWLRVKTVGSKSNRNGIGAVIEIQTASGRQRQMVRSGSSYCSQSELPVTFGLGQEGAIEGMVIRWPSGTVQRLGKIPANRSVVVDESKGIVSGV
jgi:hypothetical protein